MNYATQVPFEIDSDEEFFFFTDEERIPYADHPYKPKIEEETDDEDYIDNDVSLEVDSGSSDALSMLDENFKDTDPVKLDDALQQIVTGLKDPATNSSRNRCSKNRTSCSNAIPPAHEQSCHTGITDTRGGRFD